MNVCSLLNNPLAERGRRDSTPSVTEDTTAPSSALPTPPSERSPSRRTSGAGLPGKNRTPWDGNGYSLPLTIETQSLIRSPGTMGSTYPHDSPTKASAGHKYSDSRSSLSSLASITTTDSGSHSRISSLSTVGEIQPLDSSIADTTSHEDSLKRHNNDNSNENNESSNDNDENNNDKDNGSSKMADIADTVSRSDTGLSADPAARDGDQRPHDQVQRAVNNLTADLTSDERPESPTDALMVRRLQAGPSNSASPLRTEITGSGNASASSSGSRNGSPSHPHRQAIFVSGRTLPGDVAPDRSIDASAAELQAPLPWQGGQTFGAPAQLHDYPAAPGASYSLYLDPRLVNGAIPRVAPNVTALMEMLDFHLGKSCAFMENCDLMQGDETKWRKAMSHIFGRNKSCTRRIPVLVWVLLCRKHYQRGRYRSTIEYAKRLIRLIERQVLRLEAWSNENWRSGHPEDGIVRDWTIVVRRREQMRLEKEKDRMSKRKREEGDDSDHDSDDDADDMLPTEDMPHVPQWLRTMCNGTRYSTLQIQAVVSRISDELDMRLLKGVPDIEFLPNIEGENTKPKNQRNKAARQPSHKRTQPSQDLQSAHRASPSNLYRQDEHAPPAVAKRQRMDSQETAYGPGAFSGRFAPRAVGHTVPQFAPVRPANSHSRVPGRRALDDRPAWSGYGHGSAPGPLPDPRTSYYLDEPRGGYNDYRGRAPHQRAFSDGNAFQNWTSSAPAQPGPSSGYYADQSSTAYAGYYPPATTGYGQTTYTRPNEGYAADMNGFFDNNPHPDYALRQQQQYAQQPHHQQQAAYHHQHQGQAAFYPHHQPSAATAAAAGAPPQGGGPPPVSAAKHVRTQSTPVLMPPRPTTTTMPAPGGSSHHQYHQESYGAPRHHQDGYGGPRHTADGWSG